MRYYGPGPFPVELRGRAVGRPVRQPGREHTAGTARAVRNPGAGMGKVATFAASAFSVARMNASAPLFPATLPGCHDLLQALLDAALTGFLLLRPVLAADGPEPVDFTYVHLNPAAQRMLRLPAQPAETFLTLYPHAEEAGIFAFYREAYLTNAPRQDQFYYQRDGLDNYFHLSVRRSNDLLLVSFTDTADQDRSDVEQALRDSQVREQAARAEAERQRGELQRVFEQSPIAIAVYRGPQYVIELANPTVARLWGRTQAQLLGKGLFEALPEVAGMGYEELLDGVMSTGVPHVAHAMEAVHEREGRRDTVYWDFVYVPMYESDGSIYGAMVVATEVTGQVQARREVENLNRELESRVQERTRQLELQQGLLHQILRQVPSAIATLVGPEHRFSFFNEPYHHLSGQRATLDVTVAEALPEVVDQGFVALLDRVYRTGEPFTGTDTPVQLHNPLTGQPEQRYIDFTYQPLADHLNQPQGVLAFIVDVTDKVRARQQVQRLNEELAAINAEMKATNHELNAANARLIRTNTDLDTFVYTASHDLKAPIANIEGLLDTLRDYLPPADAEPMVPRLLDMMHGAVTRFQQTVGHLTNISRLQYAQAQPAEALVLATVVEDVRLDLAPLLAATQARLLLDIDACPTVYFSPKDLRSILYNLLSNALKYCSPARRPVVQLSAYCPAGQLVLRVEDNGLGLSEQQQRKLFTLFRRLHNHVEGSGVGLYMIKRIVENAGGSIAVESEPDRGSVFLVTLPRP